MEQIIIEDYMGIMERLPLNMKSISNYHRIGKALFSNGSIGW